jgi:hypothetical protein
MIDVTGNITPRPNPPPEIRQQPPSILSLRSSASTVAPEAQGPVEPKPPKRGARRRLWFFAALATVVGAISAATLGSFDHVSPHVHNGSPGYRMSKSGKHQLWQKKALTIYLDDSIEKLGATEAVMQAFGRWVESDQRLPNVTFDTGKTSAEPKHDGKSTISFARITAPGHERDLAITMTYSEDNSGEIVEADVVLNSIYAVGVLKAREDRWRRNRGDVDGDGDGENRSAGTMNDESEDCQNRYDVQNVATHEAGHFFGLGEDPTERDATMFQNIDQCETHKRALSTTDVAAVTTLYAESEDAEEAAAGPRACALVGAPAGSSGAAWASALIFGLFLQRRQRR